MPSLFLGQSFWTVHLQPQLCEKCKNGDIWLNMIVLWLKIMTNTDPQLAAAGAVLQRPLLGSGRAERARCCPGGSAPPAAAAARPGLGSGPGAGSSRWHCWHRPAPTTWPGSPHWRIRSAKNNRANVLASCLQSFLPIIYVAIVSRDTEKQTNKQQLKLCLFINTHNDMIFKCMF